MSCIDLRQLRVMENKLQKQIAVLKIISEELEVAEQKIKYMAYMDKTKLAFSKSKNALQENIRALSSMESVLQKAYMEYRKTEERIEDRYNLDIVIYPETKFGVSRITGMEEYRSLIPF